MTILKDLCDFYELKKDDLPERGWSDEKVVFELRIRADGSLSGAVSYADNGVKHRLLKVPEHDGRTSGVKPFFLCDKAAYFMGRDGKRGEKYLEAARRLHHDVLDDVDDPAARALLLFLDEQKGVDCLTDAQTAAMDGGALLVFRYVPDGTLLHERAALVDAWNCYCAQQECGQMVQCSVTGERGQAAILFPQQTGIPGAQSSGATLVSYNDECYCSYGLSTDDKSRNASITADAAFRSGTALSYLVKDGSHRVAIGDTQVVFWTDGERASEHEFLLAALNIDRVLTGENEALRERLKASLESIRRGLPVTGVDEATGYHLLGLAPNAARLAVRFYETGTLGQLQKGLRDYLEDIEIVGENDRPRSMGFYLRQIAPLGKADNIPNTLVAAAMAAMLKGVSFPHELFMGALGRMRVDKGFVSGKGGKPFDVTAYRVSLMKGYLKRKARLAKNVEAERSFTVALNENNRNAGYLLGRLFAALEHAQGSALGSEVNATIRDRYIGAASATPAKVFPQLLRNAQHHISKAGYGISEERRIGEIVDCIESMEGFPPTLSYDDQGQFFIGYYQQKQAIYKKNDKKATEQGDSNE